nr:host nuclease inhibitor protein [Trabulsiella guamensis]
MYVPLKGEKHTGKITAYAWASGLIEFGKVVPDGAVPVITGDESRVRELIGVWARHSRVSDQLLVPGVPEAPDQHEGMDALIKFTNHITREYVEH